jgi:hypothetical protein
VWGAARGGRLRWHGLRRPTEVARGAARNGRRCGADSVRRVAHVDRRGSMASALGAFRGGQCSWRGLRVGGDPRQPTEAALAHGARADSSEGRMQGRCSQQQAERGIERRLPCLYPGVKNR